MGLGRAVGEQRAKLAAQAAANSPLLETSISGAKRLLVNITAGQDFTIGEATEAMEYIQQFTDPDDAEIFMGHVMKGGTDGEVQITILAAGMDIRSSETPKSAVSERVADQVFVRDEITRQEVAAARGASAGPLPFQLDEIDLDIPSFLRRQRGSGGN
jgi:cell division protein FtsZ